MRRQSRIIRNHKGETLAETLVASLIIALAMLMLPGAIVASARMNATVAKQTTYAEGIPDDTGEDLVIQLGGSGDYVVDVESYGEDHYRLFEFKKQ